MASGRLGRLKGYEMEHDDEFSLVDTESGFARAIREHLDPKSRFQEQAQEHVGLTPTYRVLGERGPDHAKEFTVGVYLGEDLVAEGIGTSKQEAQIAAAEEALKEKGW